MEKVSLMKVQSPFPEEVPAGTTLTLDTYIGARHSLSLALSLC